MRLRWVVVCNAQDDSLSFVCPRTLKEQHRQPLCIPGYSALGPRRCLSDGDGRIWCILSYAAALVSLSECADMEVLRIGAYPTDMCLLKNSNRLLAACGESNSIFCIYIPARTVESCIPSGDMPYCIQADPMERQVAVCCLRSECVALLDARTLEWKGCVNVGGMPFAASFHPSGSLHVSYAHSEDTCGAMGVFSLSGMRLYTASAKAMPGAIRFCAEKNLAVVAQTGNNCLLVLDCATGRIVKEVACGGMPDDILILPEYGRVFVSCMQENRLYVYDMDFCPVGAVRVGEEPRGMCVYDSGAMGYWV